MCDEKDSWFSGYQYGYAVAQFMSAEVRKSLVWARPLAFVAGVIVGALATYGWLAK
jgi:hypothetical protein